MHELRVSRRKWSGGACGSDRRAHITKALRCFTSSCISRIDSTARFRAALTPQQPRPHAPGKQSRDVPFFEVRSFSLMTSTSLTGRSTRTCESARASDEKADDDIDPGSVLRGDSEKEESKAEEPKAEESAKESKADSSDDSSSDDADSKD